MSNIVSDFKSGVIIIFITKYLNIILQLGLGAILSRLLTPSEYGVVAVVTVFITFFSLLSELGIGPAIIQKKNISEDDKSILFNITVLLGFLLSGIFYYFSYFIADFYKNNAYINIGKLLCLLILLNTILIVPQNILIREKRFKELGIIQIISSFTSGMVAIYLAYKGWSYYSIVIQSIVVALLQNILSFYKIKIKLVFNLKLDVLKEIWKYSLYQFLFNFVNYFSRNLDNILIGKYIGNSALGYYDKAYKLMLYPIGILTSTISSAIHPILAKYQDDYDIIFSSYMKIVKLLSVVGFPLSVYLYFSSYEIINILYGPNWNETVPIFKILSLSVFLQLILSSSGSIFQSTGKTNYLFYSGILSSVTMIFAIVLGIISKDLEKVAYFLVIAILINFFQAYYLMIRKVFKKSLKDFFLNLKSGAIIGLLSLGAYIIFIRYINFGLFQDFILKILFSIIIFVLGLYITGEYKEVIKIKNKREKK